MKNTEEAIKNFEIMNCNQSVLSVYGPQFGLTTEQCLALGMSFGGGMGKQGKTCGAVTGAYLVIGLWSAKQSTVLLEQKRIAAQKVSEFNLHFEAQNGSCECNSLLKYDIRDPKEFEKIQSLNLFENLCPKLVANSTEILDKILV